MPHSSDDQKMSDPNVSMDLEVRSNNGFHFYHIQYFHHLWFL